MSQRMIAALLAVPLLLALLVVAALKPLPFVTYQPGPTFNILGDSGGREIVQVEGAKTYRDDGQLRFTTVSVSRSEARLSLYTLMANWFNDKDAVYPHDAVYPEGETDEESTTEGAVQMVSSQDSAIAVALDELGYDVQPAVEVLDVQPQSPADGELKVRDVFQEVDGQKVATSQDLVDAIQATPTGGSVSFLVLRDGQQVTVSVKPDDVEGKKQIGIQLGGGYVFPFDVSVNIDSAIGGPSAGLMFSLAIYDTLTPGSLTGGRSVAGTGTISGDGTVGPIGGIQQKIPGAAGDGAQLFLVPPDNCAEALGADHGDMRLVKATTMHSAVESIEAWVEDPDATLPSCEKGS